MEQAKKARRRSASGGATLVELLSAALCASLVALGAAHLLLATLRSELALDTGLRLRREAGVLFRAVERWTETGDFQALSRDGADWALLREDCPLLAFDAASHSLSIADRSVYAHPALEAEAELEAPNLLKLTLRQGQRCYVMEFSCRFPPEPPS